MQLGLDRLVVPENGVTSLNLEQSFQSIGAMRSRTTHPKTIALFRLLLEALGVDVKVETPLSDSTKADVIKEAVARGGEDLAHKTVSCGRSMWKSRIQPHCGTCSQCVDRRFAGIAAGWSDDVENAQHEVDIFRDALPDGDAATYPEQYVRFSSEILDLSLDGFTGRKDVWRAAEYAEDVQAEIVRIHKLVVRHSEQAAGVIAAVWQRNLRDFLGGRLPTIGLIARLGSLDFLKEPWERCAARIVEVLTPGLRKQFAKAPPANEAELQVAIDALQTSAKLNLIREYPTVSFALSGTRPDVSGDASGADEVASLFLEVKLIRTRAQVGSVTDEILADIPKYTRQNRKALFLVYDAGHFIPDDLKFSEPLESQGRSQVKVAVLR